MVDLIKARDIHVIQKDNRYVVFHPESLSLFSVTEDVGELLKSYELNSNNTKPKSENDLNIILSHLSERIVPDLANDFKWVDSEPRALSLLISQDCNLRCGYCYADHGTYGSKGKKLRGLRLSAD
jgi:uncharacterized protein